MKIQVLLLTISCSVSRQAVTRWTPSRPPGKPSRHTRHTCRLKSSGRGKVRSLTAGKINRLCLFLGWLVITCHWYLKLKLFAFIQNLKALCQVSTNGRKAFKDKFHHLAGLRRRSRLLTILLWICWSCVCGWTSSPEKPLIFQIKTVSVLVELVFSVY